MENVVNGIYLAGPFFNEEQEATMARMEAWCLQYKWPFFSPRQFFVLKKDASMADRIRVFQENVKQINRSSFVLARIDDWDPGTVWEMGHAYGKGIPVVAYTTEPKRNLNVMMAQSVVGFVQGFGHMRLFLKGKRADKRVPDWAMNPKTGLCLDYSMASQSWDKEVF